MMILPLVALVLFFCFSPFLFRLFGKFRGFRTIRSGGN